MFRMDVLENSHLPLLTNCMFVFVCINYVFMCLMFVQFPVRSICLSLASDSVEIIFTLLFVYFFVSLEI